MEAKVFEKAIKDATAKLNDVYYLYGDTPNEAYDLVMRGFILGLSVAYGVEPQTIEKAINSNEQ